MLSFKLVQFQVSDDRVQAIWLMYLGWQVTLKAPDIQSSLKPISPDGVRIRDYPR